MSITIALWKMIARMVSLTCQQPTALIIADTRTLCLIALIAPAIRRLGALRQRILLRSIMTSDLTSGICYSVCARHTANHKGERAPP